MAIDTRNKRASVQAYYIGSMRPTPDAVIDAADRATLGWIYSGLSYAPPAPPVLSTSVNPWIAGTGRMMNR